MVFVWLAAKLIGPILPYLLLGAALLLGGQAIGLPVAETATTMLWDGATALLGWAYDAVVGFITDLVVDRLNPF